MSLENTFNLTQPIESIHSSVRSSLLLNIYANIPQVLENKFDVDYINAELSQFNENNSYQDENDEIRLLNHTKEEEEDFADEMFYGALGQMIWDDRNFAKHMEENKNTISNGIWENLCNTAVRFVTNIISLQEDKSMIPTVLEYAIRQIDGYFTSLSDADEIIDFNYNQTINTIIPGIFPEESQTVPIIYRVSKIQAMLYLKKLKDALEGLSIQID